ncbi:MAG: vanadium-dependent haloperoxidase [Pirellulales bacterium]
MDTPLQDCAWSRIRPINLVFVRLRSVGLALLVLVVTYAPKLVLADPSVARVWDEQLLHAISLDTARPTVHARNLFHLSGAMYDAWAAYDTMAAPYLHHENATAANLELARNEAVSHAAYNIILHRFVTGPAGVGPGKATTLADIRQQMVDLGYNPDFMSTVGNSPAAVGNRVAQTVISHTLADGAREESVYRSAAGTFTPVNAPLTFDLPGNVMSDPNRWQPLHFLGGRIDQFGRPINESTQGHLTPFWGQVTPFAITAADRSPNGVYHDQGLPRQLGGATDAAFKQIDALTTIRLSAQLDPNDGVMIDISPASRGNTPNAPFTESYDQVGYAVNPYTGQPYEPEMVKRGDFGRVMAEFWADGPRSTAPPGHWNEIANDVSDKMDALNIPRRIGGTGPVLDDLQWDVKQYFALNGALHDAAIAAWNHKGVYDSARPISFIRCMGQLGQSSDPNLTVDLGGGAIVNTYHPDGLPLEPGLVEVITPDTTAAGERHEHLAGLEGKIAIRSWQGAIGGTAPFDDPSELSGVGWIRADQWMPYQLLGFVTPPFAGYVSGHSTFSRSAAEVMALFTGSEFFPGGIFEYDIPLGSGLDFEYGPEADMKLQFATYFDASDQASLSRIYGGIHPPADDFSGRRIGYAVGSAAFARAMNYFAGVPEPSSVLLAVVGTAGLFWFCATGKRHRGGY